MITTLMILTSLYFGNVQDSAGRVPLTPVTVSTEVKARDEIRNFTGSAQLEAFLSRNLDNQGAADSLAKTFDFSQYHYIYVRAWGDCNALFNFSLIKKPENSTLEFSYKAINGGCHGMAEKIFWFRYPKQEEGLRFLMLPSGK